MSSKAKKIIISISVALVIILIVIFLSISVIAKYLIERYSEQYTGRKIRMSWLYLNPLNGYVHLDHIKIYEYKSDSIFMKADGITTDVELMKLFKKTYEISYLTIDKPWAKIIQNHKKFNFDDLIVRFTPDSIKRAIPSPTLHLNLLNLALNDGEFHYIEQSIPVNYYIKAVNLSTSGWRWDNDTIKAKFGLASGPSTGTIAGTIAANIKSQRFKAALKVEKFDLKLLDQYLKDIANYGSFRANLDADITADGSMTDQLDIVTVGMVGINDFHFGKKPTEDYVSFDKLVIAFAEANPKKFRYITDSISLQHPYFKYEQYDNLNNVETMFGKGGANYKAAKADSSKFNLIVQIVDKVNILIKNILASYFQIHRVAIYNGDIRFNDFAVREKFGTGASHLNISGNDLDKNYPRINLKLSTALQPYGNVGIDISVDPNHEHDMDVKYNIEKVSAAMFNPYIVTYTSFPLDRGTVGISGDFHLRNSEIESNNHLLVIDPRVAKRIKHGDTKWLPLPLIMYLARGSGNAIDFTVPIRGNLKDPKFKLKSAILTVLTNLFLKPVYAPYLIHFKTVNNKLERLISLKWDMRSQEPRPAQERLLHKIAKFLKESPQSSIVITPMEYTEKEKEYILLFEAKKRYFLATHKLPNGMLEEDSIEISKLSVKDSNFVHYLDQHARHQLLFTVQDKANALVGEEAVNRAYNHLLADRKRVFLTYFADKGVQAQVRFNPAQVIVPFDGFSYYKIDYKGDLPQILQDAYDETNKVEESSPVDKYKEERKKSGGLIQRIRTARAERKAAREVKREEKENAK